ncbi:MAG: arsenate reductase family protein [Helicobacteraceae bacterium]|jgi:nitrogenase-associated protein|nr:arsenate reductase family protein [Helicobacteraceae bacterium]
MKIVLFYEKPGCVTNAKQKKSLRDAGCIVIERNLLDNGLTLDGLAEFLGNRPPTQWFNPNAPKIKSGEVKPEMLSKSVALQLLMRDPILIKRPLMVINGQKLCGFEQRRVEELLERELEAKIKTACSNSDESCTEIVFKF